MKKTKEFLFNTIIFIILSICCSVFVFTLMSINKWNKECPNTSTDTFPEVTLLPTDDTLANFEKKFDAMIYAFGYVESRLNPNVVSKNGKYVGLFQMSPIMVDECNRLEEDDIFTYDDRGDSLMSIIMFGIIMENHNPELDLRRACKIWNPSAGEWYYNRINERYKFYLKEVYNITL